MRAMWFAGALAVTCTLLSVGAAHAEEASDETRAVEMFQISERLYAEGRYEQALAYLQQAHALRPSPTLIYNMARANEKLDRLPQAIASYRDYLEAAPDAPDRQQVELRIRTLEREIAERDTLRKRREAAGGATGPATQPGAGTGFEPEAEEPPPTSGLEPVVWGSAGDDDDGADTAGDDDVGAWLLVGAGGAALVTGLSLYAVARSKRADAVDEPVQKTAHELQQQGEDLMTYGNIAVALGGVVMAGGITMLIIGADDDGDGDDADAWLSPDLRPGHVGLSGGFGF